ncbi:carbon-nitrogen hydrolase family protein [Streptomyces sp. NPDC093225]|uniref:carbon-nitrogen hydrolase family protein n=1 Tax=Streptomyces sp. NPDC093225 TaxID=3366034 RepID=UPI0037F7FD71
MSATAPLTVALVQAACPGPDITANVRRHAELLRAAGARLTVFPECSLTGYDPAAEAVTADDPRLDPLADACRETGSTALVCAALAEPGGVESLALLALDGTDVRVVHRKTHLHGAEVDRFTPGARPSVLEVGGRRIGLAICADASVPGHAAATAELGIDAYLASALYGADPVALARRDSQVRDAAAAHGVWGLLATSAGPSGTYPATSGGSGAWAPGGALVAQAGPDPDGIVTVTL